MLIKEFVRRIEEVSPRIKDIKLTQELHETEDDGWRQVEASGRWKVEFIVEREEGEEDA